MYMCIDLSIYLSIYLSYEQYYVRFHYAKLNYVLLCFIILDHSILYSYNIILYDKLCYFHYMIYIYISNKIVLTKWNEMKLYFSIFPLYYFWINRFISYFIFCSIFDLIEPTYIISHHIILNHIVSYHVTSSFMQLNNIKVYYIALYHCPISIHIVWHYFSNIWCIMLLYHIIYIKLYLIVLSGITLC